MRRFVASAAVTIATVALLGVAPTAQASYGGTGGVLTSSDGTNVIRFADGRTMTVGFPVTELSWSPDGSWGMFLTPGQEIVRVRYDDPGSTREVVPAGQGMPPRPERHHPTWVEDGMRVAWSERPAVGPESPVLHGHSSASYWYNDFFVGDSYVNVHPDGGPNGRIAYQRQIVNPGMPLGVPEVNVMGPSLDATIHNAQAPSLSPLGGDRVAFVRSDGSHDQIYVADLSGANLVQVTSNPVDHANPTWSPDGTTIAFNTGTGGAVAVAPADGSGAAHPTTVAALSGLPAYQGRQRDRLVRLFGANRIETAVAASRSHWATAGTTGDTRARAGAVVLSRSDQFADALGGAVLAAAKAAPLLLTPPTGLHATSRTEIARVLAPGSTVYLLGSAGALSTTVESEIRAMGYAVRRLAGANRYETSIAIAREVDPTPDYVLAATGRNFPDALAAAAAAGSFVAPGADRRFSCTANFEGICRGDRTAVLVLTADGTMNPAVRDYVESALVSNPDARLFGIGRPAAGAVEPLGGMGVAGTNRYDTAYLVATVFFGAYQSVGMATGADWPDALAGGALMGTLGGPLTLARPGTSTLDSGQRTLFPGGSPSINTGIVFGSQAVVPTGAAQAMGALISGPGGFTEQANQPV